MFPLLGLLQFIPEIAHLFGSNKVADLVDSPVAKKVLDIAQVLTGTNTPDAASAVIQGDPATALAFKKAVLDQQVTLEQIAAQQSTAQQEVNKVEAANPNVFISGWRPAVGWIGALGLGYAAIIEPSARFIATVGFHYAGAFPQIDTMLTLQVLLGILGLGGMRTYEKKTNTEANR